MGDFNFRLAVSLVFRRAILYTLFRQSEAAHNRYENDITDLN